MAGKAAAHSTSQEDLSAQQVVRRPGAEGSDVLFLPSPNTKVQPNICWGRHDCLFTPAYWAAQAWHHADELERATIKIGNTLVEEVIGCVLGGHGTKAEIGLAAFEAVRAAELLSGPPPSVSAVEAVLGLPLNVGARSVRYRFARRRARYVVAALTALWQRIPKQTSHRAFRDHLTTIDGIGLKTASWITRNYLDSDQVAVLDVHVLRAGCMMRLFPTHASLDREYRTLEKAFLSFANAISVRASRLDALIWQQMRFAGQLATRTSARILSCRPQPTTMFEAPSADAGDATCLAADPMAAEAVSMRA